jgi:hypothetical protein
MSEGKISFEELEAVATPPATATPVETPAATEAASAAADTKPQFTESDVEAYKSLVDMGITPQNAAEFKAAKNALDNLPALLDSNPDLLMDEIEKNNPALHTKLLERMSDRWFQRLPADVREGKSGNGSESRTASSSPAVDPELVQMKREWGELKTQRIQEQTARQQAQVAEGFNKALDALVEKLPEGVSAEKRDHIRLKAEKMVLSDPKAYQRISQGIYVDVPTFFSKASSLVTAETKAASSAEHDRRAGVEARGSKEIPAAADNVNGSASSKQEGHGADPIWGNISEGELKSAYK